MICLHLRSMTTSASPIRQQLHWHPDAASSLSIPVTKLPHWYNNGVFIFMSPLGYRVSLQLYPSPQYNLSSSITKLYTYSTYIWQSSFQEKISCTIFMLQSKSKYLWLKGVDLTIFSLVLPWLNLRKQAYIIYWMALSINLWPWKMVLPQTFRSIISQY